jgi:hypothetical protein
MTDMMGGLPPDGGAALQTQDIGKADTQAVQCGRLDPAQVRGGGSMQLVSHNRYKSLVRTEAL